MYKRFTIQDITSIKNNILAHITQFLQKEKQHSIKDYCKTAFKDGNTVYYLNRGEPTMRCIQNDQTITIIDEIEKIELVLNPEQVGNLQSLIKKYMIKPSSVKSGMSIEKILMEECMKGSFNTIQGKPYIVYDIETDGDVFDVTQQKFYMAYAAYPTDANKMKYDYIEENDLKNFVQKLLDFDGYIVGFNNIWFDNPVIIHNIGGTTEDIKKLNQKSIDIFQFINAISGKKISLNKISTALVGVEKTLSSGLEGSQLYKDYLKTGDTALLEKCKAYCKNDVKMTIMVLLYLMHYKKVTLDEEQIEFTIDDLIKKSCEAMEEVQVQNNKAQSMF